MRQSHPEDQGAVPHVVAPSHFAQPGDAGMSDIVRHGSGSEQLPFARAAGADGWLFVSGQVPFENGRMISGGITEQTHAAIRNVLDILLEAGYGPEHVVRCGVWLDDP